MKNIYFILLGAVAGLSSLHATINPASGSSDGVDLQTYVQNPVISCEFSQSTGGLVTTITDTTLQSIRGTTDRLTDTISHAQITLASDCDTVSNGTTLTLTMNPYIEISSDNSPVKTSNTTMTDGGANKLIHKLGFVLAPDEASANAVCENNTNWMNSLAFTKTATGYNLADLNNSATIATNWERGGVNGSYLLFVCSEVDNANETTLDVGTFTGNMPIQVAATPA